MIFEEKTLESERIYEGAIINLRRDKVTVKTGTSYREIIEHNGGAVICALTKEKNLIMVKQFRKPAEEVLLELPAGKRDGNEKGVDVAARELKEETGFTAGKIVNLTNMFTSPGYSNEVLEIYLATDLSPGETDFDENEAIDIIEIPLEELVDAVMQGKIKDAKTIVGIMMTAEAIRRWSDLV